MSLDKRQGWAHPICPRKLGFILRGEEYDKKDFNSRSPGFTYVVGRSKSL
jgi:hypothetical protein